ncbi:hypothetical protein J6590_063778 [Homalodisca vitripennis]|nr:hypothetical protein J6590_063778 [Homalodisca vitripennis]
MLHVQPSKGNNASKQCKCSIWTSSRMRNEESGRLSEDRTADSTAAQRHMVAVINVECVACCRATSSSIVLTTRASFNHWGSLATIETRLFIQHRLRTPAETPELNLIVEILLPDNTDPGDPWGDPLPAEGLRKQGPYLDYFIFQQRLITK